MKRVCAWCKSDMGTTLSETSPEEIITHGICRQCKNKVFAPHRLSLMDLLDGLEVPVLVVESLGNVESANKAARALLQKEPPEIEGFLGDVFECVFAKLPERCGNTAHCAGCIIRNTVMDTFQSSRSHLKVQASLTRGTENDRSVQLLISTEKVRDFVLLRIDQADNNQDTPSVAVAG